MTQAVTPTVYARTSTDGGIMSQPHNKLASNSWQEKYQAEYPETEPDLYRLAVQVGISPELILSQHLPREKLLPVVEGCLLAAQTHADLAKSKRPKPGRGIEVELQLQAYLSARTLRFRSLAESVLDGSAGAIRDFHASFGPTAIARRLAKQNGEAGNSAEINRVKTAVQATQTYKVEIKPLNDTPPRRPTK